ncbi:hypothetical protein Pint_36733 [Pistacia integerrima]|nr:hypothetical protein Pint_36733 [Pistacia integerrima]
MKRINLFDERILFGHGLINQCLFKRHNEEKDFSSSQVNKQNPSKRNYARNSINRKALF